MSALQPFPSISCSFAGYPPINLVGNFFSSYGLDLQQVGKPALEHRVGLAAWIESSYTFRRERHDPGRGAAQKTVAHL